KARLVRAGRRRVVPAAQAQTGQSLPRKQRAGVLLALGRDVAVADDVAGFYAVACHDVAEQRCYRGDLRVGIGVPATGAVRQRHIAGIDDFNADGGGVEPGSATPAALARMPGAAAFVHELQNAGGLVIGDEVMTADL